jgi:glycosyltransferase involved in cell wall biosynthesis
MNISVLLPVYNSGSTLNLAIESILAQDFANFEVIIIDDASTDTSAETIREYTRSDPRVRAVFHKSNFGLAKTLNEGIRIAEGEFIARMDQDDEALPHRLRTQYLFMKSRPKIAVAGSYVFHMGKNRSKDRLAKLLTIPSEIAKALKTENCIYHSSVIFRRKEIIGLGGYRSGFKNAEDYDLWLRVSQLYELANIPVGLLRYRFSVDGMTLSRKWDQLKYVILVQLSYEKPNVSLEELDNEVGKRIENTNKRLFLQNACRETAKKLFMLGYRIEVYQLIRSYIKDIGVWGACKIMRDLFQCWRELLSSEDDGLHNL